MLWLALFLPDIPLIAALGTAARQSLASQAMAVADGPENRPTLRACNAQSCAAGISMGMSVAQARALCGDLTILPRQIDAEDAVLQSAALLALAFTPMVAIEPDRERHCIVMEISASVKLFGGISAIARKIFAQFKNPAGVARFGDVFLGLAPTPLAAELFARQKASGARAVACLPGQSLPKALGALPITIVPWLAAQITTLHTLGLTHLRDVFGLPRDGLTKRFGAPLLLQLDRCAGHAPDPRIPYLPAAQFKAQLDCITALQEGPQLMAGVEQLLQQLANWLRARASGTRAFTITFFHRRDAHTTYPLSTHAPARDVKRWAILLTEHFQRTPLSAPVHALTLHCPAAEALSNDNTDLLPAPILPGEIWEALIDRLIARLGGESIYRLRLQADHRPERAFSIATALHGEKPQRSVKLPNTKIPTAQTGSALTPLRPTFLLNRQRALITRRAAPSYHGPLALLTSPERIQSGWWDDAPIERDYFIARNPEGTLCWIYRALNEPGQWYLHGVFA